MKNAGEDVEMLEAMLWRFGVSPQLNSPGSEGARINSDRGNNKGLTKTCDNQSAKDRSVFYPGSFDNCSDTSSVSTEVMVQRFIARNTSTGLISETKVKTSSSSVDNNALAWLKRDWENYYSVYQANQTADGVFTSTSGDMPTWITEAVNFWENGSGDYVTKTLQQSTLNKILVSAGMSNNDKTTADLLTAWLSKESPYHWGDNAKHYQKTPYRMNEGGADENGSLSFSQLLYQYRYGPKPCAAHADNGLNLYHPGDNLKTMVIHTSANASAGTGTGACEGGLHKAFVSNSIRKSYQHGSSINADIRDLVGYIDNKTGQLITKTLIDTEDDYEALAKGIAIYNGAADWMNEMSWPRILTELKYKKDSVENKDTAKVCHSCRYTIEVRELVFGTNNLRSYVWKGGQDNGVDWCFAYGEKEWVEGNTWGAIKTTAENLQYGLPDTSGNPDKRTSCP